MNWRVLEPIIGYGVSGAMVFLVGGYIWWCLEGSYKSWLRKRRGDE